MFANTNIRKYQSLLIAISLFLLLFISVLMGNYFMQRNLIKSLNFQSAAQQYHHQLDQAAAVNQQQLLTAMLEGSQYTDRSGASVELAQPTLQQKALLQSINPQQATPEQSAQLLALATSELERKQKLSTSFLMLASLFAVLLYVIVLLQLIRRLGQSDDESESSKQETANIMATVSEGLFLLGRDYEIGVEQSESLKKMFDTERDLEGNFFDFIRSYVTESTVDDARDYIDILFGERVKEKLIAELNPLTRVQVHITRLDGSYESRYLKFNFKRVFEDEKLAYLLVSTVDITRQVMLEIELEETKERQESQIDLLMSILHVDGKALSAFFDSTEEALNTTNNILQEKGHSEYELKDKITNIYRYIHKIKGDSASLGLYKFEALAHQVEEELEKVRLNPKLSGEDLLDFAVQLKDMFQELENMKSLVSKISNIRVQQSDEATQTGSHAVTPSTPLLHLVNQVSERTGKSVALMSRGLEESELPEHLKTTVNDIVIQLIRNSITHGIETPENRQAAGKAGVAQIVANFNRLDTGEYELIVQDDGTGVDEKKVLTRALDKGLIKQSQVGQFDSQNKFARLLFSPGFSTEENPNLDAGRGVGLDLVRQLSREQGGRISLRYKQGQYCRFRILFPPVASAAAA